MFHILIIAYFNLKGILICWPVSHASFSVLTYPGFFPRKKAQSTNSDSIPGALDAYKIAVKMDLPMVSKLLHVICALPITSAEAERSFSVMKRLKSPIRSTMTDDRYFHWLNLVR